MAELAALAADAAAARPIDCRQVGSLVGRLVNLSQVLPELLHFLPVGYALSRCLHTRRGRPPRRIQLKSGSRRHREWQALLDSALATLDANVGVAMAPDLVFPSRALPETLTTVTDASGDDGFGGWAWLPSCPDTVFLMSVQWPSDIRLALARAAAGDGQSGCALSMPSAELFAARALADAVAQRATVRAVVAIGDCKPACRVLSGAVSPVAQMRAIAAVGGATLSLGVHVRRGLNLDADRLSHPQGAWDVAREARDAGWRVQWLWPTDAAWRQLRDAVTIGCGRIDAHDAPARDLTQP